MKQKQKRKKQRYGEFVRKKFQPAEMRRLALLRKALLKLGDFPCGNPKKIILYNIHFFDIISQFQDEGYLIYQPHEKEYVTKLFNLAIRRSGRQNEGMKWNMTKKGEKVTTQNVLYGGIFGLPIKPAIYWLNLPKSKKITLDLHSSLALNVKSSHVVGTMKIWETELLVNSGIEKFTINNLKVILDCLDQLLN